MWGALSRSPRFAHKTNSFSFQSAQTDWSPIAFDVFWRPLLVQKLKRDVKFKETRGKLGRLSVFFEVRALPLIQHAIESACLQLQSLDYELISETPAMDAVQLLSNLGGTTGLWAGVSIVTFMEFIDLLLSYCFPRKVGAV